MDNTEYESVSQDPDNPNLLFAASQTMSFLIVTLTFPFYANLIKYRVNYVPRRARYDQEGRHHQLESGANSNSYFGLMKRVVLIEGWGGLYKGIAPTILMNLTRLVVSNLIIRFISSQAEPSEKWKTQWDILADLLQDLSFLPLEVIRARAITTASNLPWLDPDLSSRILLTEVERRRPSVFFITPGCLFTHILSWAHGLVISHILFPSVLLQDEDSNLFPKRSVARLAFLLTIAVLDTVVTCPLDAVSVRLFIQRNYEPEKEVVKSSETNNGIHSHSYSYTGFLDCARRVVKEEGYPMLFRGWCYHFITSWLWIMLAFAW